MNKIITAGQEGVDVSALRAAVSCGLQTGGFMPNAFMDGPHGWNKPVPERAVEFGLQESKSKSRASQTRKNIAISEGTLWLDGGQGVLIAASVRGANNQPYFHLRNFFDTWDKDEIQRFSLIAHFVSDTKNADQFAVIVAEWIIDNNIQALHVGGNIYADCEDTAEQWFRKVFSSVLLIDTAEQILAGVDV